MTMLWGAFPITTYASNFTQEIKENEETDSLIPAGAQEFNGNYYMLYDESKSWSEAQAFCESMGGHLVCIGSQNEQDFLIELSKSSTKKNLWIGAKTDATGIYSWVSNEAFGYTNWAEDEPNNLFDSQYTAMMYTHNASYDAGLWNDENENGRSWSGYYLSDFGFVCEWEADFEKPTEVKKYGDHYYKVYSDASISWHDAKEFCESLGGHLVTITSAEEDSFVYNLISSSGLENCWGGGTDENQEGVWEWVTGEIWGYSNAHFDNCRDQQHYLVINHCGDFLWDDQSEKYAPASQDLCETQGFVCEWDDSPDITNKIVIHDREFDQNIDYYTANCDSDSSNYNPILANMLAALSAAAYDEDEITDAYEKLGFLDDFSTHYYSIGNFDPNFCSYTIGFKDSEYNNEKVCLITVRGSDSFSDWVYNFDIFTAEEKHQGFFAPALVICQKIGEILSDNGILPNDVKYVITGHSRGAAVGNLLAVELMEQGINAENVYNYNYACPDVACKADFPNYNNIFNLCNTDDLVAFVPGVICNSLVTQGASWGKYGQTYWFTKDVDGFFASHSMNLYLEFFNRQLRPNASDWPFEYESMASGVLTKVFCPVDVIITDEKGNPIASVINGEINYSDNDREIIIFTDDDKKIIYHNEDADFYVSLIGTDEGTMTFSIEKCNLATGEVTESKTFNDVVLEDGKTMYCPVSETTNIDNVSLYVVEEKDGEMIYTHTIGTNGTETVIPCEHTWSDGEITKHPTTTESGEKTYTCNECGATKTEEIAPKKSDKKGISSEMIITIVVASVVVVCIITTPIVYFSIKKKKSKPKNN